MAKQKKNASPGGRTPDPRPLPPRRPGNDECCGCGCIPCIFDLYDEHLQRYQEELAAWEKRHAP